MGGLGVKSDQGQIHNPDSFTGDGSTVAFTLSHSISSPQMIIWVEGGVPQIPTTDFTVDGVTVTRTTAPANLVPISVLYLGATAIVGTPSDSTVTLAKMAVNSVDSDQYVDGSIDAIHLSANSVDSDAYVDASIDNAHLADDAVGVAELSATGTASSSTFLRGDNAWAAAGGVATGFIGGLTCSNDTDASHDVLISVGSARDYGDAVTMTLGTAITKRIDATWAVGDDNGGLDTGSVGANAGYGVWLIRRADTGVVDAIFSLDKGAAGATITKPTNYDQIRLIGWVRTDASNNITAFTQSGDYFRLIGTKATDISDSSITDDTYETGTLTVPPLSNAHIYAYYNNPTTTDGHMSFSIKTKDSSEVLSDQIQNFMMIQNAQARDRMTHQGFVFADSASQVEYGGSENSGAADITITLIGCQMFTRSNP